MADYTTSNIQLNELVNKSERTQRREYLVTVSIWIRSIKKSFIYKSSHIFTSSVEHFHLQYRNLETLLNCSLVRQFLISSSKKKVNTDDIRKYLWIGVPQESNHLIHPQVVPGYIPPLMWSIKSDTCPLCHYSEWRKKQQLSYTASSLLSSWAVSLTENSFATSQYNSGKRNVTA